MLKHMGIACAAAALLLVTSADSQVALGQNLRPSSVRSRPVISPYFELLRNDTGAGGVPPYHFFLQRDRSIQRSFSQQERQTLNQRSQILQLERATVDLRSRNTLTIRQATSPQVRSQAGTFLYHSHFYGGNR